MTNLQNDVIRAIRTSCYYPDVWSDCIKDNCQIATTGQIPGIVASLVKEKMVESTREFVYLTPKGEQYVKDLGPHWIEQTPSDEQVEQAIQDGTW